MEAAAPLLFHEAVAVPDLSLTLAIGRAASSLDGDGEAAAVDGKTMRLFRCLFCDRTFAKSQALGGHQNAHRKDRIFGDPYICDPDADAPPGGAPLSAAVSSSGLPCDSAAGQPMRTSNASHSQGGSAASPPAAPDACKLTMWSGAALLHPSDSGSDGVVGTGEALDLELRL